MIEFAVLFAVVATIIRGERLKAKNIIIWLVIATLLGVALTIASGLPPLSIFRDWVYENNGRPIWLGVQTVFITFCCLSYTRRTQKHTKNEPEDEQKTE